LLEQYALYGPLECSLDDHYGEALRELGDQTSERGYQEIIPGGKVPCLGLNGSLVTLTQRIWPIEKKASVASQRRKTEQEWKTILSRARFLIPASFYYWNKKEDEIPLVIWTPGQNPFMFAAVSSIAEDTEEVHVLIGPAPPSMMFIADQAPLVMPVDKWRDWLTCTPEQARSMMMSEGNKFEPWWAPRSAFFCPRTISTAGSATARMEEKTDDRPNAEQLFTRLGQIQSPPSWHLNDAGVDDASELRKAMLLAPDPDDEVEALKQYKRFTQKSKGKRLIAKFIENVKDGSPIPDAELVALAEALEPLLSDEDRDHRLRKFAKNIGLNASAGRYDKGGAATVQHLIAVQAVLLLETREGVAKHEAMRRVAGKLVGDDYEHKLRDVERWDKAHRSGVISICQSHEALHGLDDAQAPARSTLLCQFVGCLDVAARALLGRAPPVIAQPRTGATKVRRKR
jgi:hypothetical protein